MHSPVFVPEYLMRGPRQTSFPSHSLLKVFSIPQQILLCRQFLRHAHNIKRKATLLGQTLENTRNIRFLLFCTYFRCKKCSTVPMFFIWRFYPKIKVIVLFWLTLKALFPYILVLLNRGSYPALGQNPGFWTMYLGRRKS